MLFSPWLRPLSAVAIVGLAASTACSSGGPAGGAPDGGAHDALDPRDTSESSAPDARDDAPTTHDAGHSKDAAHPDAASACGPESTASFKPSPYVAAVAHQGVCSTGQALDFINSCVEGSASDCLKWQDANLMVDGGPGTACGNCILPNNTNDNGALWLDPLGSFWPNYGACIQLSDSTHGEACAVAFDDAQGCVTLGCDNRCTGVGTCSSSAVCQSCFSAVQAGSCSSYAAKAQSACTPAKAAYAACSPSSKSGTVSSDYAYIIELICGGSAPADSGTD